jgi:thioredoxin 1
MSNIVKVTGADEFKKEVLSSTTPVLVDFWAEWCGPCKMMEPILESLAGKYEGKLKIVKMDTEEPDNQDLAIQYQIQSIPNMKLFKNGEMVKEFIGFRPEEMFEKELKELL